MNENYRFIKAYQKDDLIRGSFNNLAKAIFSLDFEDWYQNGYWGDNYIPYSILDGDEVVANVSVSPMKFIHNGEVLNLIQLGTVMSYQSYRKQGLIRQLMHEIEQDYQEKIDGYFLFANDSVLEFYPKFGYKKSREYEYFKDVNNDTEVTAENVAMKEKEDRKQLEEAIRTSSIQSDLWLQNNLELVMFYIINFMDQNVYVVKSQKAYVIAEINNEVLHLKHVFASEEVDMNDIIAAFGKDVRKVVLEFAPLWKEGYSFTEMKEKDTTLFVKGDFVGTIEKNYLRIPSMAHA